MLLLVRTAAAALAAQRASGQQRGIVSGAPGAPVPLATPQHPQPPPGCQGSAQGGQQRAGLQAAGPGAGDEGDYDKRAYALRLEALRKKKHATTALLLEQIDRFKRSLEHEEMLSTMRGGQ